MIAGLDTVLTALYVGLTDRIIALRGLSAVTARRPGLFGYAGYGYCASHSRWYWAASCC
jgi:hypothetical protein